MKLVLPLVLLGLLPASTLALWPQPTTYKAGKSFLRVSPDITVSLSSDAAAPSDLKRVLTETTAALRNASFLPLQVDRGASWQPKIQAASTLSQVNVVVAELLQGKCQRGKDDACSIAWRTVQPPSTKVDNADKVVIDPPNVPDRIESRDAEAYTLTVPQDGSAATVTAWTALGALRALESLKQLVYSLHPSVGARVAFIKDAPLTITDRPAFPHRGILLDTARNFFSPASIRALLDAMVVVKMNQLHWHMTDTHSWPLSFESHPSDLIDTPLLAQKGSYPYQTYTEAEVSEIIEYAASRGINVNIEIDMPAHLKEGVEDLNGNLITCADEDNWAAVAAEPPSGQLNLRPTPDAKGIPQPFQNFVATVLNRVSQLSRSSIVHAGGDEPNLPCWGLKAGDEALIDEPIIKPFISFVSDTLAKTNKTLMLWEEMAIKFPATGAALPAGTIVQTWLGPDSIPAILAANPATYLVHSSYTNFYLDCGMNAWVGNNPDGTSWCPYVTWQKMYSFDPYNGTKTPEERARILGGETALWSEAIDECNLQQRAWPRAASAAEVFWTGDQVKRDVKEALDRILEVRERLVAQGFSPEPLQPQWCVLRRGRCDLPPQ